MDEPCFTLSPSSVWQDSAGSVMAAEDVESSFAGGVKIIAVFHSQQTKADALAEVAKWTWFGRQSIVDY